MELIDGALIQIEYVIRNNNLWSYRLAFLPNPRLIAQEIEPDMYETEELFFIDSINKPVIHPVIRFDFDNDPTHYVPVKHSRSHLTIGQSDKCRIALSEPLTPYKFITFIFEHFYGSLYEAIKADLIISINLLFCIITAFDQYLVNIFFCYHFTSNQISLDFFSLVIGDF